jgi:hypothetical protein
MIEKVVQELQGTHDAILVSKIGPYQQVGDIDFFCSRKSLINIQDYLIKEKFLIVYNAGHGNRALVFFNCQLFVLDIADRLDSYLDLYPYSEFTSKANDMALDSPKLVKFMKYTCSLRSDLKATLYVEKYFIEYSSYLSNKEYIHNSPFRSNLAVKVLLGAMKKRPLDIIRTYNFSGLVNLFFGLIIVRLRNLNSGKIIAFVGSDGSGKTTIIENISFALSVSGPIKVQYMGDFWFILQPFYIWLHKRHIILARMTYPFFYIENWFRYIKIRWWKLCGYTVLTDRWPGLNRHLRKPGRLLQLNDLMYKLYPNADSYVFVSGPPAVVHARRDELTVKEIEILQSHMRERLAGKSNWYEAHNVDLDDCLNGVLRHVLA